MSNKDVQDLILQKLNDLSVELKDIKKQQVEQGNSLIRQEMMWKESVSKAAECKADIEELENEMKTRLNAQDKKLEPIIKHINVVNGVLKVATVTGAPALFLTIIYKVVQLLGKG